MQRAVLLFSLFYFFLPRAGIGSGQPSYTAQTWWHDSPQQPHPGPLYPLSTERTVSQSHMGAGHEGRNTQRGSISLCCSHKLCLFNFFVFYLNDYWIFSFLQVVRKMMWLMDHVFKYTNFGLVSLIHGDFFIRQVSSPKSGGLTFIFTFDFNMFFFFSLVVVSINTVCFTFLAFFFLIGILASKLAETLFCQRIKVYFSTLVNTLFSSPEILRVQTTELWSRNPSH